MNLLLCWWNKSSENISSNFNTQYFICTFLVRYKVKTERNLRKLSIAFSIVIVISNTGIVILKPRCTYVDILYMSYKLRLFE